ncbi:hypothetical protein [Aureimonas leprariae]|uniref:Uncharacterized protein n=1 Tax=Plantimonas leprariae TaxID=2615207 RepID=A0A7V7PKR8_9HYPH|nr:hypothetical protein [Aureimonas leprariae]KAB0676400.1 hypothetical protein F6X38_21120 [Aureimonas leprariae]
MSALADDETRTISDLARSIARDRETARRLSMTFACRLLDLCLVEVAMVWQGRDELASPPTASGGPLAALVETKMRLAMAEQNGDGLASHRT